MSVYVDDLVQTVKTAQWPYTQACHMTATTEAELIAFARRIGLRWLQRKSILHFDLTARMRERALKAGAVAVSSQQVVALARVGLVATKTRRSAREASGC